MSHDLPDSILGAALGSQIFIDVNGAGHGWFIDATPLDDREFARWTLALAGSPAHGHADLLTVVEHEIGHLLGLAHSDQPGNLMQDTLSLSTRRWATAVEALIAQLYYEDWLRGRRS